MCKKNCILEPIWSYGDILPPSLVDLIENSDDEESVDEFEEDDFEDILDYLDDDEDDE